MEMISGDDCFKLLDEKKYILFYFTAVAPSGTLTPISLGRRTTTFSFPALSIIIVTLGVSCKVRVWGIGRNCRNCPLNEINELIQDPNKKHPRNDWKHKG